MDPHTNILNNIQEVQYLLRKMRNEIVCCLKTTSTVKTCSRELATALAAEEAEKVNLAEQDESVSLMESPESDFAIEENTLEPPPDLDLSSPFEPMRQSSTPLLLTTSTESAEGISIELRWKHQPILRLSKVTFGQMRDDTRSEIILCDLNFLEHSGPLAVCENDSVTEFPIFMAILVFVGSSCYFQPFVAAALSPEPPEKPPDKSINTLPLLDSHIISKLLGISHMYVILHGLGGVLAVERSDFDLLSLVRSQHIDAWISHLRTEVPSIEFSSLFPSLKPEVVERTIELEFWAPFSIFPTHLHLCISYVCGNALKTIFMSSDMRWTFTNSHNNLCHWNTVQLIWSWFGKSFWLPTDDIGYLVLWHGLLTKVGNFVLVHWDMSDFAFVLKNEELILCGFAQKVQGMHNTLNLCASSSFVVLPIISAAVTLYLNLNLICKHVIDYTLWFNGASEDKVHGHVVLVPCRGALLDHLIAKEMDGLAKLDQPIIVGWSGEVILKGFAKFLVCKEQANIKHDIIIIGIATEGTSPSNFSFTIGTAWVKNMPCNFSWKVIPWVHTCLTQDSEAVKVYLERSGLKRHYNSVMRCLSDYFSIISSGCYIEYPLMLNAKSTWMVDWYLTSNDMMTLQMVEKDGQIFGTHWVQILCFSAHQEGYDFFPKKISHWVAFFASHWITFLSQIYATMNWKLDKMEGTQIYEKNLQQHILFESLGSDRHAQNGEDAISLKFISPASYNVMVAAVVVNQGSHDCSTTSQLTQWMRENARCTSLENHVMQQQFASKDQQSHLGATGMSILLSIEMNQCSYAPSYVVKIETLAEACDPVTFTKLEIVAGLTYLETKKPELVASKILQPGIERGNTYSELTAPQDVAIYVRLCALASFDSTELKNKVINNSNFKSFLEFVTEVRELINDFHSSHDTSSLGNFGDNKLNLFLDINAHPPAAANWE